MVPAPIFVTIFCSITINNDIAGDYIHQEMSFSQFFALDKAIHVVHTYCSNTGAIETRLSINPPTFKETLGMMELHKPPIRASFGMFRRQAIFSKFCTHAFPKVSANLGRKLLHVDE